jgi:hypothetical protein
MSTLKTYDKNNNAASHLAHPELFAERQRQRMQEAALARVKREHSDPLLGEIEKYVLKEISAYVNQD